MIDPRRCYVRRRPGCPINNEREDRRRRREREAHFLLFDLMEWEGLGGRLR
jgi:hypothetical protein